MSKMAQQAQAIYLAGANCAEAVWQAYAHKVGIDPEELELGNRLAGGFGGGAGVEDLCGAVAGGIVALGHRYGRRPDDPRNPKLKGSCEKFCRQAEQELGSLHCRDLRDPNNREKCGPVVLKAAQILSDLLSDLL
ncbi:MAG: C-GCAxxG-C-C family protein [bacterium]|jgi:C_GCAxxG_C_C family probable redox protein|nr:C_GCAxxG_C_C family protein [Bacillota bacterium]